MERLYLIRVGMERFLGPYTLKQVQEAYHKMQFGLQDEISGSLRQWVSFDNIEGIRRHYPELVQLIHTEMMSGWGMTVPPTAQVSAKFRPGHTQVQAPPVTSRTHLYLIALILGLAGIVTFFSYRDGEWVNPVAYMKERTYYQAKSMLSDGYNKRFEGFIDRNRSEILKAMKFKKGNDRWLPYVRAVAYAREGTWDGVTQKKLRGAADSILPQDCSLSSWDERWKNSKGEWGAFVEGRRFVKEDWSRILLMDTHWIKNRSPMPGWMEPGSFYEACLRMASKAMERYAPEDNDAKTLLARLRWQLSAIQGKSMVEEYEMSGTLWAISCLEDARVVEDLKACLNSVKTKGPWQDYFDAMMNVRRMSLIAHDSPTLGESDVSQLQQIMSVFQPRRADAILDYEVELKFYQEIIQQKGHAKAAKAVVQKKFPSVRIEP